jgi:hypothetical protein
VLHKLGLAQVVSFLVVKPTYPDSNPRFDVCIIYLRLIIFSVVDDVPVDTSSSTARRLLIDFMNLKIKSIQSFKDVHRDMMCVCVFIGVSAHICMSICVCTV